MLWKRAGFGRIFTSRVKNTGWEVSVKRVAGLLSIVLVLASGELWAKESPENRKRNPQLLSMTPMGGAPGSSLEFRVRGEDLEGIRSVWLDSDRLTAKVKAVKEIKLEKARFSRKTYSPGQEVFLQVDIAEDAAPGAYSLRLLTEWGLSGPVTLVVSDGKVVQEQPEPHQEPDSVQLLELPANLNGRIGRNGEVDFYAFEVLENQELQFEVLVAGGILPGSPIHFRDPELILYQPSQGWFQGRARRLETRVDSTIFLLPVEGGILRPRLRHRFSKPGRYLVAVGSLAQKGGPGHNYQLRIAPVESIDRQGEDHWTRFGPAHDALLLDWRERGFGREIHPVRRQQLRARGAAGPDGNPDAVPSGEDARKPGPSTSGSGGQNRPLDEYPSLVESEPDETPELASSISLPVILQGRIDAPGDLDHFRFSVEAGQRVAFEIQTVDRMFPELGPWLEVLDASGQTVCSNIYRSVENNSAYWQKFLQSKAIYTFEEGGDYILRLRDLTSRRGGEGFTYRVLVRPQVPHIGVVSLAGGDHINLVPGEARTLKLTLEREEGLDHMVTLHLENLPPGIQLLPTVVPEQESGKARNTRNEVHPDRFFPRKQEVSLTLLAEGDTPGPLRPHPVRLAARVVADGRPSQPFPLKNLLLTVVKPVVPKTVSQIAAGD